AAELDAGRGDRLGLLHPADPTAARRQRCRDCGKSMWAVPNNAGWREGSSKTEPRNRLPERRDDPRTSPHCTTAPVRPRTRPPVPAGTTLPYPPKHHAAVDRRGAVPSACAPRHPTQHGEGIRPAAREGQPMIVGTDAGLYPIESIQAELEHLAQLATL